MTEEKAASQPTLDTWGMEYNDKGIVGSKNLYVTPAPQGVKTDQNAPHLAIAMPSRGMVPIEVVMAWKRMSMPINTVVMFLYTRGMMGTSGREAMTIQALEQGAHFIYFADDDVMAPPNTLYKMMIEMLKDPTIGLITGVYTTKQDPPHPHIYKEEGRGHYWGFSLDPYDPVEDIWGCGAGCIMVRADAFRKMEQPYWSERSSRSKSGTMSMLGHDLHLCEKVRAAGYRTVVDGSLLCGHIHEGKIFCLPNTSPPMQRHMRNPNTMGYWNKIWGVEHWGNPRIYKSLYDKIVEYVPENAKVVDLGAGIGVLLQYLINKRHAYVTGIELSEQGTTYMQERGIPAVRKSLDSLTYADVEDAEFVLCTEVLEHLEDVTVDHIISVLANWDGTLIVSVPYKDKVKTDEHVREYDEKMLATSLSRAGFAMDSWEVVDDLRLLAFFKKERSHAEDTPVRHVPRVSVGSDGDSGVQSRCSDAIARE